jgi:hypothetical protein
MGKVFESIFFVIDCLNLPDATVPTSGLFN